MARLKVFQESTCACDTCRGFCEKRPCWPTPPEAQALIDAGYRDRLMRDYWCAEHGEERDTLIIAPAQVGYEGRVAPYWVHGRCTFLTDDGRCELHEQGLKPLEGRAAHHSAMNDGQDIHRYVASTWKRKSAQALAKRWHDEKYTEHRKGEPV